jgi:beta-lactamase regulating signal transducer with metallopeptidase domain/biopolymer transport protein ExbD
MMTALNDWGASWSVWFLSAVVQNTIFLVLVLAALFLLRRASARVLAAVATVGVIKLAIPPFVSTGWFAGGTAEQLAEPVAPLLFPFSEDPGTGGEVVTGLTGGLGLPAVLMLAWVSIMTARLGSAILQSVQLYVELRRSTPVDPEDIPLEMREMGLDIRRSHRVAVPLTMGLFNRRVLVPASWSRWSGDARLAVLRHELAHIRRRDNFIQPIEVLVQAVFFFHPLVHLLIGRLRVWREMACDDLSVGRDPHLRLAYSRFLVELAETVLEPRPMTESASTLMRRRCELMKRVTYQVKEGIMNPVSKLRLTLVVAVLLLAIAPLSLVHGDTPPPPKKPAPVAEPIVSADPAEPESIVKAGEPVPADAPPPPPPSVRVGLSDDGLTVNGKNTPKSEFNDALDKAVTEKGGQVVVSIDSDGAVTMGKVHMMQADLRDLGLYKVIYTGELGEAVPVMLPPDKAREKLASLPPEQVLKVKVNGEGVITVDGKQIDGADLPKLIHKKIAKEPHLVVSLHTESETRYGAFLQTLQGIKKGGADKIAILDPEK